jgi:hypothetical protein
VLSTYRACHAAGRRAAGFRAVVTTAATAVAIATTGSVAFADNLGPDGDTAKSGNNISYGLTATTGVEACSTRGTAVNGVVDVNYQGSSHFDQGATVTITVTPRAGAGQAASVGITATGGSNTVPTGASGWDGTSDKFSVGITTTTPASVPNGTYTLDVAASGAGHDNHGDAITYQVTSSYTVAVSCGTPADTTPPVITKVVTGTLGSNNWYTSNVTVDWTVTDAQSTVTSTTGCGTQNFTSETAAVTSSCSATSAGGTSSDSVSLKIDKTGPTSVSLAPSGTLGTNDWFTSNVAVTTNGTDALSGVTCSALQNLTSETSGTVVNGSCTNGAGLTTNAAPITVKIDKTAPTSVVLTPSGDDGSNGWYTSDVDVTTTGTDALSGVSCTTKQTLTSETDGTVVNGSCTNGAGLASNADSLTVKIDKTGPTNVHLTPSGTLGLGGWYTSDVTITTTGEVVVSDPAPCTDVQHLTEDTDSDGVDFDGHCTNDAGLSTDADTLTVKRDASAPTAEIHLTGTEGANGWYTSSVDVDVQGVDDQSGVTCDGDTTLSAETTGLLVTGYCVNGAGVRTDAESVTVKIDKTAPSVDCADPDELWHKVDVSIACTASDDVSNLADSGDAAFNLSTDVTNGSETSNASTDSRTVYDAAGNSATADPVSGNKVDKKAPTYNCGSADGSWHGSNVTITCTASDGGSGLDPADDAEFDLSTTVADGNENDNASTGTKLLTDAVGNSNTAGPITGNKIDRKAPEITCASADGIWHKDDVDIACTASDGGSALKHDADESFNLSTAVAAGDETDNASTGTKSVEDAVGNSATAGPVSGNKVDKLAPTYSCGTADSNWHGANVTIACTAGDGGSGLSPAGDASFNLSTSVVDGVETNNASTGSKNLYDAVGNSATAGPISGNKVDKKGPTVACDPVSTAWLGVDAALICSASDGGSGLADSGDSLFTLRTSVAADTEDANASTDSKNIADGVGNATTAGPYALNKIDKKAPTVSCGTADSNWHQANVSITCTAGDDGSGLADPADASFPLTTTVAMGSENSNASTGSRAVADNVGHSTTAGPITGNKIDRKAPGITISAPTGVTYTLGQAVAASYSCSDGGSGVASCSGTYNNGANIDTITVGVHTFTVQSTDNVGNTSTAEVSYNVVYSWTGFFQPVDNLGWNSAKAGQAIPVKFNLGGNQGTDIFAANNAPKITATSCPGSSATVDPIETYVSTAGGSSLIYDTSANQYVYVWKTDKLWASKCYVFSLALKDGSAHTFKVQFTK